MKYSGRSAFQGVGSIVRFNWHFYAIIGAVIAAVLWLGIMVPSPWNSVFYMPVGLALVPVIVSLAISWYIYDFSDLYELPWLPDRVGGNVLNVHAGFDETSQILREKSPEAALTVWDFYDPKLHTEVSIRRARRCYPPFHGTISSPSGNLHLPDGSFDTICVILSAHEIRDDVERIFHFNELKRLLEKGGRIYVTEHLRDWKNFLAYTVGFLHFHSRKTWLRTFSGADLKVVKEVSATPFITTFVLEKHGDAF